MKIAVFGSTGSYRPVGDAINDIPAMWDFCLSLGKVLAEFSHTLLLESDQPNTADRKIVDGILGTPRPQQIRIRVYYQPGGRTGQPFDAESAQFPELFTFRPLPAARLSASHLRLLRDADLAIIIGGGSNSYAAGLGASMLGVRVIPVAVFGGAGRLLWQQLSDQFDSPIAKFPTRRTWDNLAGTPKRAIEVIRQEIAALPRLMIVHGRSNDRVLVQEILTAQGVIDPIVLRERFKAGETIPEKFEREAVQADGAIVLFTPDDEASSLLSPAGVPVGTDELRQRVRARQNVSLEYGWFWGRLGRDRVLLLLKGELELPSDLVGLLYHSYKDSPYECAEAIAGFVEGIRGE
jgi:predicted nucleotide-binding protein